MLPFEQMRRTFSFIQVSKLNMGMPFFCAILTACAVPLLFLFSYFYYIIFVISRISVQDMV